MDFNQLHTFELIKPLVNLVKLDLGHNFLVRFILDMKDLLPGIRSVNLETNKITDFEPIGNNLSHPIKSLNLNSNQIQNINTFEWILLNRHLFDIEYEKNFPLCDCSSKERLKTLAREDIVQKCILLLPVPEEVQIKITYFECPDPDFHDSTCTRFHGLYIFFTRNKQNLNFLTTQTFSLKTVNFWLYFNI